jgi:hypothetical protein
VVRIGEQGNGKSSAHWILFSSIPSLAFCTAVKAQEPGPSSVAEVLDFAQSAAQFDVNTSANTTYETNVVGGNAATATLRHLKPADVIFAPSLAVTAFRPIGQDSVFLTGSAGYDFYARNSILNRENIGLNGGANGQLGLCHGVLTGGYSRRQQSLDDVVGPDVQNTIEQSSVGVSASCGHQYGFAPTISLTQSWVNNSQFLTSNSNTLGGTAGLAYTGPALGTLTAYGLYQRTDFPSVLQTLESAQVANGYTTTGGGVKLQRVLGARIQGVVSVGYTDVKPDSVGTPGFGGLTYGADVIFRVNSRVDLHGSFDREVLASTVQGSLYRIQSSSTVEATYKAGSRLKFKLGLSDQNGSLPGQRLSGAQDLSNYETKSIYASAIYTVRKVFISADVSNIERSANVDSLSYADTRAGVTLGAAF